MLVHVNLGATAGQGRVNASSKERVFSLEGYEEQCFIDPNRQIESGQACVDWDKAKNDKRVEEARHMAAGEAALDQFENAALGAKLRNANKVSGKRFKEMDHFVAVVETPEICVHMPTISQLLSVSAQGDPAQLLPLDVDGCPLHVHRRYLDSNLQVSDARITACALLFKSFLRVLVSSLLLQDFSRIRLFYMTTMRHNDSVAHAAGDEVHFNVMAFQQQACCDCQTGTMTGGKRPWVYWLQRAALALKMSPTGLYDTSVRHRFDQYMTQHGPEKILKE
eukprot:TRINITY_DN7308_c0_g2_i7.p2 TRINITY_DN7308_c0_g2~~TRINITY_DN7308_c0_g2_i7.p2  ORF type:complete len:279 (+),score=77.50 TRINITY_DN7308_c0_g2_i7:1047-1883(+)